MLIGCRNPQGENKTRTILFKVVHYILNRSVKDPLPPKSPSFCQEILGNLSNEDGDVNENGRNENGLFWQNNNFSLTSSHFLYISLPSLHDYDEKMPDNFTFFGGLGHKTTTFFFFS